MTKQLYGIETLDDLLLKALDETLKGVFKEAGTRVIYDCLENNFHLKREEIAVKLEAFSVELGGLLGSAAPVIEKLILENLFSGLELKFVEKKGYRFSDYVEELRKR